MNHRAAAAIALAGATILSGCATKTSTRLIPDAYSGPVAYIVESTARTGSSRASGTIFFALADVDGVAPALSSADRTRIASRGQGFRQNVVNTIWTVKAGPARLKLAARVTYGAPIQEIFAAAASRSVEGTVEADLQPSSYYLVKGVLDGFRSEIWLEDPVAGGIVGQKITKPLDPAALAQSDASGRFTCCNLRYDDKLITDENFALEWPLIPAGTRVAVVGFHGNSADVIVDGRPMVFDVYVGRDLKPSRMRPQELADRYAVAADPAAKLATYPPEFQQAIREAKVMRGMTREQVLMSLGYPWSTKTPSLDDKRWVYFGSHEPEDEYVVVWGDDGTLADVEGRSRVKAEILK